MHINADGGDGGKLATASRVSTQREAMARYVAGLTKFIYEPGKSGPIGGNMAANYGHYGPLFIEVTMSGLTSGPS
jgi:hypothetical protein